MSSIEKGGTALLPVASGGVYAPKISMKILGLSNGDAGGYYRIVAPFSVLGYCTEHIWHTQITGNVSEYDVLWIHQLSGDNVELAALNFKQAGGRVIYDIDDWLPGLPPTWPCYTEYFDPFTGQPNERFNSWERMVVMADVVTTTTEALAVKIRLRFGPKVDMRVLPNCVLRGDWDWLDEYGNKLDGPLVGWFGTDTHWDDWREIAPAVDEALEAIGGYLAICGAPGLIAGFPARLAKRTVLHPLLPINKFGRTRALIRSFDVGIAWCTNTVPANLYRSPLKALQYGASGVPVVCSETVYGETMAGYGIVVGDASRLSKALVYACHEHEEMVGRAKEWQAEVWRSHSYEQKAGVWLDVIEGMAG